MGEGRTEPHSRRLTASQAAEQLGVSTEAIRGRIRRGTIGHERVGGRVYVLLPAEQPTEHTTDQSELVDELRRQNEYLREENRRKDHLLAAALERIPPQLEPPSESPGAPETATPQPGRVEPQTPLEGAQEPRESSEMHMPEVGGGPLPHNQQRAAERRWWEFWR